MKQNILENTISLPCIEFLKLQATSTLDCQQKLDTWYLWLKNNDIGDRLYDSSIQNVNFNEKQLNFLSQFVKKPSKILILEGSSRFENSSAAVAISKQVLLNNYTSVFYNSNKLMLELSDIERYGDEEKILDKIEKCHLLIINNFHNNVTEKYLDQLYEILDYRTQFSDKGTIITSEHKIFDFVTFYEKFGLAKLLKQNTTLFEIRNPNYN